MRRYGQGKSHEMLGDSIVGIHAAFARFERDKARKQTSFFAIDKNFGQEDVISVAIH